MLLKILIKSKLLRMGAPVTALKLWCRFDRAGIWIDFWSAVKAVSELGQSLHQTLQSLILDLSGIQDGLQLSMLLVLKQKHDTLR
jgi:hypothetical protein